MLKCDQCDKNSTIHMTEIDPETKKLSQIHLCDEHAIERLAMRQVPASSSSDPSTRRPLAGNFVRRHFCHLERWSSLIGAIALGYMTSFIIRMEFAVFDAIGFVIAIAALIFMAAFRAYLEWIEGGE
jgi:hypothetical protein